MSEPHRHVWRRGNVCWVCGITKGRLVRATHARQIHRATLLDLREKVEDLDVWLTYERRDEGDFVLPVQAVIDEELER